MPRTLLVRVRQHDDGLWYPEIQEGPNGEWRPKFKAPFWEAKGYKTRGSAALYFGPSSFLPHTWADGVTWPPRYAWAPGEEYVPKRKKKKKQPKELDLSRWAICTKGLEYALRT